MNLDSFFDKIEHERRYDIEIPLLNHLNQNSSTVLEVFLTFLPIPMTVIFQENNSRENWKDN